ncbi:MAG: Hpt domain-containing protein [Isosphaeraceae bacterium]
MGADDTFRMMFFEEARELLISLEEGLVELERRQGDRAHLDKTFRAAHSIKGAAAMVGLPGIAEFTHGIEAVLDCIRSGTLAVDSDVITTLLESRDHLAAMVEAEAAGAQIPPSVELEQRLSALLKGTSRRPLRQAELPRSTPPAPPPPPPVPAALSRRTPPPAGLRRPAPAPGTRCVRTTAGRRAEAAARPRSEARTKKTADESARPREPHEEGRRPEEGPPSPRSRAVVLSRLPQAGSRPAEKGSHPRWACSTSCAARPDPGQDRPERGPPLEELDPGVALAWGGSRGRDRRCRRNGSTTSSSSSDPRRT